MTKKRFIESFTQQKTTVFERDGCDHDDEPTVPNRESLEFADTLESENGITDPNVRRVLSAADTMLAELRQRREDQPAETEPSPIAARRTVVDRSEATTRPARPARGTPADDAVTIPERRVPKPPPTSIVRIDRVSWIRRLFRAIARWLGGSRR